MISSEKRLPLPLVVPFVALALVMSTYAQAARARPMRVAPAASGLIPVWAYVNGAYPVAGGRVVIMAGGKPVRQLSPRTSGRTNVNGVALVSVRRVPHRFSVIVQGGRVAGRRLFGALRSLTESGQTLAVVEVNPLTSLVVELRRQRPGLGLGRASREVKRYFGVPWWSDLGQNLRDGPHWFSARAYVRDASQDGSINRLNRAMARRILSDQSGSRHASPAARFRSAFPPAPMRSAITDRAVTGGVMSKGGLVSQVFNLLGATAAGTGAQGVVGGALGGLLELAKGAGLPIPKSELEQVQEQLRAIGAQLTELQGQMTELKESFANSDFSRLFGQSALTIAQINRARVNLEAVASASDEPQRQALAKVTIEFIGAKLTEAPELLDGLLNPAFGFASNPIKAMSHALATSSRFFDERQSNEVRSVYEYYATAQAQLTVLLTNYWNANPVAYSVAYRRDEIMKAAASVTKTERESLRPTVPAGTFLDTRTPRFMWGTANRTVNALTLLDQGLEQKRTQTVGGFDNYQMPSFPDFRNLVKDRTGVHKDNPRAWLQAQVRVRLSHQLVWAYGSIRDSTTVGAGGVHRTLEVRIFDLATGREEQHGYGNSPWVNVTECVNYPTCVGLNNLTRVARGFLASKSGGLLLLRYLAPGESYWW